MNAVLHTKNSLVLLALGALLAWPAPVKGQEFRQLTGMVTTGYESLNQAGELYSSPFFGVSANLAGFWRDPRVLTFDVQPDILFGQHFLGPVATQTGKGIAAHTSLLGGSRMPLTISFAHRNLKSPTFASESELYRGITTTQRVFGIDWAARFERLPSLNVHYSRDSDTVSVPWQLAETVRTKNHYLEISSGYRIGKWELEGMFGNRTASNPLLSGNTNGIASPDDRSHDRQIAFSASRPLPLHSTLMLDASHYTYDLRSTGQNYNTAFTRVFATLRSELTERISLTVDSAYLSNVGDYTRQQILSGSTLPSDPQLLKADVSTLTSGGSAQVRIAKGLFAHGQVHKTASLSQTTALFDPSGDSYGGGASYSRQLFGGQFGGSYGFTSASTHGQFQQKTVQHIVATSYSRMLPFLLQFTASGYYNRGQLHYGFVYPLESLSTTAEVSRPVGSRWSVTGRFEFQRTENAFPAGNRSSTKSFGVSVNSKKLQLSVSQHLDAGLAYRFGYSVVPIPTESPLLPVEGLPPLLLTAGNSTTASGEYRPWKRLELRVQWARYHRELSTGDMAAMRNLDARVNYDFRKLRFTGGYMRRLQETGNTVTSTWLGKQFYVQVNRQFRIF